MLKGKVYGDVNEYIKGFPAGTRIKLTEMRKLIKKYAPDAEETIGYNMPAYRLHGVLVYFAGYKNHIGFYPAPTGVKTFEKDLAPYKTGKGSVQFPLDKPMPLGLITKIIQYQMKRNAGKVKGKKK